jgi:hypothetical protein
VAAHPILPWAQFFRATGAVLDWIFCFGVTGGGNNRGRAGGLLGSGIIPDNFKTISTSERFVIRMSDAPE